MGFNRSKISTGVKSAFVYTLASLFSKGLSIITVPIFTRLMSPSEIGVVDIYNSWHSIIAVVASLALTSGGFQLAMKEFKNERCQYISSILTLTSGIALLIGCAYALSPAFWEKQLRLSRPLMILLIVHLLLSPAYDCWLMWQKYEYKYIISGLTSMFSAALAVGVSVWAIFVFSARGATRLGEVRLFSNYTVQLAIAFVLWIYFFIKGKTFFSVRFWSFSLSLSIPLIGNSLASQILSVSDRIMIDRIMGNHAVGIYGTLYTASSIFLIVWNAVNTSFIPFLFDNLHRPDKQKQIKSISALLLALVSLSAFLITLVAPEIVRILATKEYFEAIYIMPPIAAGVFLTAVSNMYSNILIYHKKTEYIMISTIIAAVINLVLNYYGIRFFGYMAAAYTTLIAYMIHAFIQAAISIRVHHSITRDIYSVYDTKFVFILSLITVLMCMICIFLYQSVSIRYFIFAFVVFFLIIKRDILFEYLSIKGT